MSNYKAYGTVKAVPNRKTRKGLRNSVFIFNKMAKRTEQKAKREVSNDRTA